MPRSKVYLDYNSTTPLAPEVYLTMTEALQRYWANPNSSHEEGVLARQCIEKARGHVAAMIGAKDSDIIFTSGCTEANNSVLRSCVRHHQHLSREEGTTMLPHIVTSNLEHGSVIRTARDLADNGEIELTVIKANPKCGHVLVDDVIGAIKQNTILVSIMHANNETGVIQPVKEISLEVAKLRKEHKYSNLFLHTDTAQTCGKIPVDVTELGVDFLSIAGHKFYGPRVGALYIRDLESKAVPFYAMIIGVGQERGYRSGTEDTGYIAGMGKAAELVCSNLDTYHKQLKETRDYLEEQLTLYFGDAVHFNARFDGVERIPNTCNVSLIGKNLEGWNVLKNLKNSMASTGSACHSKTAAASETLLCSGVPEDIARNAMRLSLGRNTTKEDIDIFIADLRETVKELKID